MQIKSPVPEFLGPNGTTWGTVTVLLLKQYVCNQDQNSHKVTLYLEGELRLIVPTTARGHLFTRGQGTVLSTTHNPVVEGTSAPTLWLGQVAIKPNRGSKV